MKFAPRISPLDRHKRLDNLGPLSRLVYGDGDGDDPPNSSVFTKGPHVDDKWI